MKSLIKNKTQTAVNSGDKHCEFSHFCKLDVEEPLLAGSLLSGPLVSGEVGGGGTIGWGCAHFLKPFPYFRPENL